PLAQSRRAAPRGDLVRRRTGLARRRGGVLIARARGRVTMRTAIGALVVGVAGAVVVGVVGAVVVCCNVVDGIADYHVPESCDDCVNTTCQQQLSTCTSDPTCGPVI